MTLQLAAGLFALLLVVHASAANAGRKASDFPLISASATGVQQYEGVSQVCLRQTAAPFCRLDWGVNDQVSTGITRSAG